MPRELKAEKIARAAHIEQRMFDYYGEGSCSLDYRDPFTLVVAVVLSAQCTDAAVNKATPALFDAYPSPIELAQASAEDVGMYIRSLGFWRAKAQNLIGLAQKLISDFGGQVPCDIDLMQSLPGVGRKTANVVMCEAFKNPQGIAVDTHVFRIAHRLNLAGPSATTPEKTEQALLRLYPADDWFYINHQWVHFGREFCRARNPRCSECFLADLCPRRGV